MNRRPVKFDHLEHERYCARIGVCGARDRRDGGVPGPFGIGPNGWCKLPLGHPGPWHSQDPEGHGGFALGVGEMTVLIRPGDAAVWR